MVNGLAVLGWGVGGIEAEAAMLGQPISMLIPEVIGFRLTGTLAGRNDGHRSRAHRHPDAAQEGRGRKVRRILWPGPGTLSLEDMATIANMAPEYGATCGFFPISAETLNYHAGHRPRAPAQVALVEKYGKAQGMFWTPDAPDPDFTDIARRSISPVSSLRSPARSGRRTGWRCSAAATELRQGDGR